MPTPAASTRCRFAAWLVLLGAACAPDGPTVTGPDGQESLLNKGRKPGTEEPPPPPPPQPPPPSGPLGYADHDMTVAEMTADGWTLAFQEEFDTASLARWNIWAGGAWNNELQLYRGDNLAVAGGFLTITARREAEPVWGATNPYEAALKSFAFTSARIESFQHFSASRHTPSVRMAARIKLPAGHGIWPAFWSYGDPWPTQGEIDILEMRGDNLYQYETAYWYGRRSGVNLVTTPGTVIGPTVDLTGGFHVYEVVWAKDLLSFYFDGTLVEVKSGGYIPNMFGKSQRVVLNVAVGGDFFPNLDVGKIPASATMTVDWVRALTR